MPVPARTDRRAMRPILLSSFLGSAVEFYDFLLYGLAASLVFGQLFFADLEPAVATIASFGTLAVGYVVRPLGGIVCGHFGDRFGRKSVLVTTMSLMGAASFLIGLLPTQASIGMAAPLLLVALRVVQGLAVGGEWGGAALMALEHSETKRRGFAASVANMGGPAGAVSATVVFGLVSLLPEDVFLAWGWRVPFLISAVLVGIGLFVRLKVSESPVFVEAQKRAEAARAAEAAGHGTGAELRSPLVEVLVRHPLALVLSAGGGLGTFALQALMAVFVIAYAMEAGHSRTIVLTASAVASVVQAVAIPLFAALSDRIGRRPVMLTGVAATILLIHPVLVMIGSGSTGQLFLGLLVGQALLQASIYGPLAAYISEMFGARSRYTGASMGYQLSTTLGGGFTPIIAASLLAKGHGDPVYVSAFVIVLSLLSGLAIWLAKESSGREIDGDLDADAGTDRPEAEQPTPRTEAAVNRTSAVG